MGKLNTTAKKTNTTSCGDWHLGWGYINNKLGDLSLDEGVFTWKGHCQGRHGQKGSTYSTSFKLTEWYNEDPHNSEHDWIEYVEKNGGLPAWSELQPAIEILLKRVK
jgi:hypothetical protein